MMIEKKEDDVVTVGFDDFTKAAGYGKIFGKLTTSQSKARAKRKQL